MTLTHAIKSMFLFKTHAAYLVKVTTTKFGWLLTALSGAVTFFASEKYAFTIVLVAIFLDAIFGIMVSIKAGKFALSKLGRVTTFKIVSYGASLVLVFMLEKLAHDTGFFGVKVAAAWAVACEFWSMSASILIIWPEAAFFRIMRKHLKGEMAAKLGTDLDAILPEEKTPTI